MTYTLTSTIALQADQTGLALRAQMVDVNGVPQGAPITTGFIEFGGGFYGWTYGGFPEGFRGSVQIKTAAGEIVAVGAINPQEAQAAATAQLIATKLAQIGALRVGFVTAVADNGEIILHEGDDYSAASPVQMTLADYAGPSLTGATVQLVLKKTADYKTGTGQIVMAKAGELVVVGTAVTITFTMTAAETGAMLACPPVIRPQYWYEVVATTVENLTRTLAKGPLSVLARVS